MSLTTIERDLSLDTLHALGSVSNLGSEVLQGDVQAYALGTFGDPGDAVTAGYFAATPGAFRMTYPFNEQAVVVQGSVTLTDVATGDVRRYGVGDSWFVTKGTEVIWKIEGGVFIKHYFAVA